MIILLVSVGKPINRNIDTLFNSSGQDKKKMEEKGRTTKRRIPRAPEWDLRWITQPIDKPALCLQILKGLWL